MLHLPGGDIANVDVSPRRQDGQTTPAAVRRKMVAGLAADELPGADELTAPEEVNNDVD